ncbi:MAG: hypothetical protein WCD47_23305 [Candidatus Sulfotelmatobacter sp.]
MKPEIAFPLAVGGILAALGTTIANANGLFSGHPRWAFLSYAVSIILIALATFGWIRNRKKEALKSEPEDKDRPHFSIEALDGEIHSYSGFAHYFSLRNCGGRTARDIRFEPLFSQSRNHAIRFNRVPSLAKDQRAPLDFDAGADESWIIHPGVANHLIAFVEDNPAKKPMLTFVISLNFLDGNTQRTEQHVLEAASLRSGGIRLNIHPLPTLAENEKHRKAREAIGRVLERLSECERDAYAGANGSDYERLLKKIAAIKHSVSEIAGKYLDSSFESRFLAVNVFDVQLDEATRMHFITRAQGSFWTMYQQVKGWRACLVGILKELGPR